MPIYQYDCANCRKRVDVFFRSVGAAEGARPACPDCGGKKLTRVMSTFVRARTTKQRLEEVDTTRVKARLEGEDLRTFARWAKEEGSEFDEDLGTNYREIAERAEAGEDMMDRVDAHNVFLEQVAAKRSEMEDSLEGAGGPPAPSHPSPTRLSD